MTTYNIAKNIGHTVTVDGVNYGSPLVLDAGFTIRPVSSSNPNQAFDGLTSTIQNAYVTVAGSIYGSAGSSAFTLGGLGGVGVDLAMSGDHILNNNNISGGAGGNSNGGGYGGYGGAGGTGLNLMNTGSANPSSNDGAITGGGGGSGTTTYGGGAGGIGVNLESAVLSNIGRIQGGSGGNANASGANAGSGGAGAALGSGAILNTSGSITGGNGGNAAHAGTGGTGVSLAAGATLNNTGNHSTITGGNGGYGTYAGDGGIGVSLAAGAVFTGSATIHGGTGGGSGYALGAGGAGVNLAAGAKMTNEGSIVGGNGDTNYGVAGAGAVVNGGSLLNFGSISAGQGNAAVGVYINYGGSLFTDGHISGASAGTAAVKFGDYYGTMSVDTGASFTGTINNFYGADVIDLLNVTPQQAKNDVTFTYDSQRGFTYFDIKVTTASDGTLSMERTVSGNYKTFQFFNYTPDGTGGTDLTATACFLKGTRIRTEAGEAPIEDLKIGQRVLTRGGTHKAIKWIARRSYESSVAAGNDDVMPVLIQAGALADGVPHRDLCVSPMHAMFLDGLLIPAIDLVNGTSIVQLQDLETIEYFHIELEEHDVIFAEGAATESYVDDDNRMMFSNAADYFERYPHEIQGPCLFCAPRLTEGFELEAIRRRLAARAWSHRGALG